MTHQEIKELAGHRAVSPWIMKLVCDAVAKEREACAKVCEAEISKVKPLYSVVADNCVKAIRARGERDL
jgi:hypothetical protein